MQVILGIIIGLLIAILIVATEIYLNQNKIGIIKEIKQRVEGIDPPQGMIIFPKSEKQTAVEKLIEENDNKGEDTPYEQLVN